MDRSRLKAKATWFLVGLLILGMPMPGLLVISGNETPATAGILSGLSGFPNAILGPFGVFRE